MGCDYYENILIKIVWTIEDKVHEKTVHYDTQRGYLSMEDSDEDFDVQLDKQMERIEDISQKILFKNGEWQITSKDKISEYKDICDKKMPCNAKLVKVLKFSSCEERM